MVELTVILVDVLLFSSRCAGAFVVAVTVNDSVTSLLAGLPLVEVTLSVPVCVPTGNPVLGRIMTLEDDPPDIVLVGIVIISKFVLPDVILVLTPFNETNPVLLIVVDTVGCVPYPNGAAVNDILVRFSEYGGLARTKLHLEFVQS